MLPKTNFRFPKSKPKPKLIRNSGTSPKLPKLVRNSFNEQLRLTLRPFRLEWSRGAVPKKKKRKKTRQQTFLKKNYNESSPQLDMRPFRLEWSREAVPKKKEEKKNVTILV